MYLLLAENNYISSREIKSLLDKNRISCEIVNCSSSDSLLDIAEKIAPDLVIIDFDLFIDDSANIVKELRRHSPGAYILAFVDPDHYSRLHRAIDDGIDNYMVKPLQREDVLLRIKMGLQHKSSDNSAFEGLEIITEPVPEAPSVPKTPPAVPVVPAMQEEPVAESKKLFEDLAELFDKQVKAEEVEIEKPSEAKEEVVKRVEEPLIKAKTPDIPGEIKTEEIINEQVEEAADLDLTDLSPRPEFDFTWPGSGDINAAVTSDAAEVEIIEEPVAVHETDDDTLFGLSLKPEVKGFNAVEEPEKMGDPQTLSLIDEAFSLVDKNQELESVTNSESSAPAAAEKPVAESNLPYFDDLFNREPLMDDKPTEGTRLETAAPSVELTEPEAFFEKETKVPNDRKAAIDDKELFGMTSGERSVDRSSFEELFGSFDEPARKRKKTAAELGVDKTQKGKVEYLPFARKSAVAKASIPVDEIDDIFKDQLAVSEKPRKQKAKPQKSAKVKHKPPLGKKEQSGNNFLRVAGNIITALLLILMVGLSFFLIQSRISGGSPAIAGYQMYVVLSGSMNPAFNTGSIVFVKPTEPTEIVEGDIITFSSSVDANRLTTHRVVGLNLDNGLSFITRGDANNVTDPSPVPAENLVGRVTGSVPYIGYLFGYAQTRQGLVLLIFIPGLLLIIMELRRLFKYMVDAKVERLSGSAPTDSASPVSSPVPQAALNRSALPGSEHVSSLEDFGF